MIKEEKKANTKIMGIYYFLRLIAGDIIFFYLWTGKKSDYMLTKLTSGI